MKTTIFKYIIIATLLITLSCSKFLEIAPPKMELTTDIVFADSANADAALVGVYIKMMEVFGLDFCTGGITAYTGLSSDELYQTRNDVNSEFFLTNILPTNATNLNLWTSAYKYLYSVNACIEGIEESHSLTDSQKKVLIGEAKCIRAFLYFNLVNLYGAVPLALTTDYQINRSLSRSTEEDVYSQIIQDLLAAKSSLPPIKKSNTRAGYYAATSLLARIYLYQNEYEKAKEEATSLINLPDYELMPDLDNVFIAESNEIIWGIASVFPGRETWEGYFFVPSSISAMPTFVVTDELYNAFEPMDKRKERWIRINTVNGQDYPLPYKYKLNAINPSSMERYTLVRLAEMYLLRAEAYAHLNEISNSINDINVIRRRAGLTNISNSTQTELLDHIEQERKIELMFEWGHRWFDLKRTGRIDVVLSQLKPNWQSTSALFPIPQNEMNNNPNLLQNDGY